MGLVNTGKLCNEVKLLKRIIWPRSFAVLLALPVTTVMFAQTVTTIATFNGANGSSPYDSLIQGTDGNLYGTTADGGTTNSGTVFQVSREGVLTVIHSFVGLDGSFPTGALVEANNGRLYGTAEGGGAYTFGVVFEISTSGEFKVLHSFTGLDGVAPYSGLIQASDGNLYGTTTTGGTSGLLFGGTIFRITLAGVLTTLFNFNPGDANGYEPFGALLQGRDGNLYGTTGAGGIQNDYGGSGTLFKISLAGKFTLLHQFSIIPDTPSNPAGALIQDSSGNLYGVTSDTGLGGKGSVYRFNSSGVKVLHNFTGGDGWLPTGLLIGADGNLYGATQVGGEYGLGTVFQITSSGSFTTLVNFGGADGGSLIGPILQLRNNLFVGTTFLGGPNNLGTVYKLTLSQ